MRSDTLSLGRHARLLCVMSSVESEIGADLACMFSSYYHSRFSSTQVNRYLCIGSRLFEGEITQESGERSQEGCH